MWVRKMPYTWWFRHQHCIGEWGSFCYRYQMDMGKTGSGGSNGDGAPSTPAAWDSGFGDSEGFAGCSCAVPVERPLGLLGLILLCS